MLLEMGFIKKIFFNAEVNADADADVNNKSMLWLGTEYSGAKRPN